MYFSCMNMPILNCCKYLQYNYTNCCTYLMSASVVALPSRGKALYIDPGNYDSPEDAVKNFAKELDRKLLNLDKVIGGG